MKLGGTEKAIAAVAAACILFTAGFFTGKMTSSSGSYMIATERSSGQVVLSDNLSGNISEDTPSQKPSETQHTESADINDGNKDNEPQIPVKNSEMPPETDIEPQAIQNSSPGQKGENMPVNSESPDVSTETEDGKKSEGLVNINTAGITELCTLPQIGQVRAEAIIAYRENTGKFKSIADIMQVKGIGTGIFERIKDLITV